jgi:hypothetical protein
MFTFWLCLCTTVTFCGALVLINYLGLTSFFNSYETGLCQPTVHNYVFFTTGVFSKSENICFCWSYFIYHFIDQNSAMIIEVYVIVVLLRQSKLKTFETVYFSIFVDLQLSSDLHEACFRFYKTFLYNRLQLWQYFV